MTYSAEISTTHPALFGFLIDQSGSMGHIMAGAGDMTKGQICADYLNEFFNSLILRNIDGQNIKNRFEIFAIGYGGINEMHSALPDVNIDDMPISLEKLQSIAQLKPKLKSIVKRIPDGAGGTIEEQSEVEIKKNEWIVPTYTGQTPMGRAFRDAYAITKNWVSSHSDSYPPIIINITDGGWTDENPEPIAENLKLLKTDDGQVLVFNISITKENKKPILFPDNTFLDKKHDDDSVLLFRMSSNLTDSMINYARNMDIPIGLSAKGFVYNANFENFINFLDIGTRPAMG